MRRGISIVMFIFGLNTVLTGIWNFFPPFDTILYIPHVVNSCVFGALAITHACLNRKSMAKHFERLGRWWVLVGLGFAAVIWLGIIMPILIKAGSLTL